MDAKELHSLLFSAIKHHNDSLLEDLLGGENDGTSLLDTPGPDGHTLLHVAVLENDLNCLTCLLKYGADPNVFDTTHARSPLHIAVELGLTEIVATFLMLHHLNIELRDDRNLTCYEIAQFCDNQSLADLILDRKKQVEKFRDEFYNVMNKACTNNEPKLVRELFERYEEKILNNLPKGWHPYKDKRLYSRSMLKELINWSSSSWNDVTLLFKSASRGHTEVCKLLIDFGATAKCNENTNYSPLYVAAYGGYTDTVKLLLDSFPSLIQEVTIEKWTVLHACCLQGHSETAKLILNYPYPDSLKRRFISRSGVYEFEFSFNLNAQDAAGQTVIYLAVSANNESLLDILLGFNIEARLTGNSQEQTSDLPNQFAKQSTECRLNQVDLNAKLRTHQQAKIIPDRQGQKDYPDSENGDRRLNSSNQIDRIMRQLRNFQFSKRSESVHNSDQACVRDDTNKYLICPFEMDTYCDYNSKTALHLAVCQQYHNIATTLLVNGSNPNLPILFRKADSSVMTGTSGPSSSVIGGLGGDIGLNWLRSSKSTCLKEACRLGDEKMCEILIRYGARDNPDNLALQVAATNKDHSLISMFLSLKSNVDPEYKINKKCNVEFAARYKQSRRLARFTQSNTTTTFSSMFPSTPVTIDWQNLKCLERIDLQWLIDASLFHNKRLRHPTNSLMAITRLDISSNNLKAVHPVIFRLPSLRELNLSSNALETLMCVESQRKILHDREPTLTSKLIESQRTAMKRSKSSHFTGTTSFENSNVIDLNEPQEWDLPYLEVLDLHDNLLLSLPDCLFELPRLKELDVSSNQLRQLPWSMWTSPSLKEFIAASNLLEDLPKAPPQYRQGSAPPFAVLEANSDSPNDTHATLTSNQSFDQSSTFLGSLESEMTEEPVYIKLSRGGKIDLDDASIKPIKEPLIHLNHWTRRIEITSEDNINAHVDPINSTGNDEVGMPLNKITYLNLSQNSFTKIPPVLACIAVELTRLNLSYNRLETLGDISLYPSKIKNLDLSNNQLTSWFQFNQQADDTKHCFAENVRRNSSVCLKSTRGHRSLYCIHKLHQRLENLKSLNLNHNYLKDIQLLNPTLVVNNSQTTKSSTRDLHSASPLARGQMLLYPNITALDVSYNRIQRVPNIMHELKDLSVLNLNENSQIATLPAELGLASKLWNLGVNGCNLSEPLKSIVESKTYKTMDIIGYLRSILEESKPYARMKLMLVGLQGIGKTTLLEQMRQEGSSGFRRRAPEHWTKRMGHTSRNNLKNQRGVTLSTVGVDIHDWVYQKRTPRNQHNFGSVSFSTWDFGGQEEFYATHRYFLSRRSIYLVVWRLTDGINGILGIQQWLVNIQSRAPGSPVIIVATHEDMIEGGERSELVRRLQAEVHKRFIEVSDHDKCGLPRIMDSIVVSTKTKLNIKLLCDRIYDVVFSLRCPGSTERLLEQKIPATYLYLEEIVSCIVHERHQKKREPVLTYSEYRKLASEHLKSKYNKTFRDLESLNSREINYNSELQQATRFLHENGVLLHYEDSNLRDLYFLDPQWLCDILSHVVTIREINPHVKNGLMMIGDLCHLFKSMDIDLSGGVQSYVVNLLNKFEVALTWNSQYLLIPSLLPNSPDSIGDQRSDFQVKLAPRMRGRSVARRHELNRVAMRSSSIDPTTRGAGRLEPTKLDALKNLYEFEYKEEDVILRFILLRYLPAGFLSRLQSGILSDPAFDEACEDLQLELCHHILNEEKEDAEFLNLIGSRASWICWKKGIRLTLQKESTINTKFDPESLAPNLMAIQELTPAARETLLAQIDFKVECSQVDREMGAPSSSSSKTRWVDFDMGQYSNILVVTIFKPRLKVISKEDQSTRYIDLNHTSIAKILSKSVDCIDNLLEDWYPSLGARFAHTLGGNYLVTRIVPCQGCSNTLSIHRTLGFKLNVPNRASRPSRVSQYPERASRRMDGSGVNFSIQASNQKDIPDNQQLIPQDDRVIYCYHVEQCILNAYDLAPLQSRQHKISMNLNQSSQQKISRARNLSCPQHGSFPISSVAPDIVFDDVPDSLKIDNDQIERCRLIGRGALGFVFKGSLHSTFPLDQLGQANQEVALKLLQPVDPGPEADQTDLVTYKSAQANWTREPYQCSCKSYCTARHEVNILQSICHPNIVSFIGLCFRPLAIVLELAPLGSMADVLKNYKRACVRVDQFVVQKSILQVAKALEFLHQHRIIYRDLKSENILVWSFPSPFATKHQTAQVELKLADYGISRQALSTGIWKGFAGTMSYLAPEILRHNGDEEYTEKVDCFSFGMFLYELLSLRPPYKQNEGAHGYVASRSQFPDSIGPTLTNRDLIYPSYILDLMSICCSQEPIERPDASQIVSLASTPEFMQIRDAVLIDSIKSPPSLCCAINFGSCVDFWFESSKGKLTILSSSMEYWTCIESAKIDSQPSDMSISAMCLIEDELWLCDKRGKIYVTSARARHTELNGVGKASLSVNRPISPSALYSEDDEEAEHDLPMTSFQLLDHRNGTVIMHGASNMLYVKEVRIVVFLAQDGHLWICNLTTMICEQLGDISIKYNCIALPKQVLSNSSPSPSANSQSSNSASGALVSSLEPDSSTVRLYCGQSNGISLLEICEGEIRRQSILPLANNSVAQSTDSASEDMISEYDNTEISHIVTTDSGSELLWTAAGCTVHLWSIKTKHVIRKLECWKLVPCSESLESINIEHYYERAKSSQVTSIVYLDDQLFVGTSHGCIIVIEASSLKPMTVFRPFESNVLIVRPSPYRGQPTQNETEQQASLSGCNLVALGFGYRDIMSRYLLSGNLEFELNDSSWKLQQTKSTSSTSEKMIAVLLAPASQYNL